MSLDFILTNLLNPPILFFVLGLIAVWVKSDLDLPEPLPKVLSLYLLFAIGFKGGVAIRELEPAQLGMVGLTLGASVVMAAVVPCYAYAILRRKLDVPNAAAVAATYGSISAVTFITAAAYLDKAEVGYGGYMVAAMALMESPAIVVGVLLVRLFGRQPRSPGEEHRLELGPILHEAFLSGPVFLLLGALLVGAVSNVQSVNEIRYFVGDLFQIVLILFLLDMGLVAGRKLSDLRRAGGFLVGFSLLMPLFNAAVGIGAAYAIGLGPGDALLLAVLFASASYIAVPAAMRLSIPDANPSLYVPMALALTFPFNIILGIPLYYGAITALW